MFDAIGALLWSGVAVALGWIFRDAVNDVLAVLRSGGPMGDGDRSGVALVLCIGVKEMQRHRLIRMLRMARVSVDELNAMLDDGERPLIVDVRSL